MGIEQKVGDMGAVTMRIDQAVNWARTYAMWPMLYGIACCAIEMMAGQGARYDMSRFGMELMRATQRQSDLMIISGRVTRKMAPVLRLLYNQMPSPKWSSLWVIAPPVEAFLTITPLCKVWMRSCRWMYMLPVVHPDQRH